MAAICGARPRPGRESVDVTQRIIKYLQKKKKTRKKLINEIKKNKAKAWNEYCATLEWDPCKPYKALWQE
jgi:hypothetical protein